MSKSPRIVVIPTDAETEAHDHGLAHDLQTLAALTGRRRALHMIAGATTLPIFGCASTTNANTPAPDRDSGGVEAGAGLLDASGAQVDSSGGGSCSLIPEETGGPYPGDGTNGPNVLNQSGIVRSDIRSSFGAMSGVASGISLTVNLTVVNTNANCTPLTGYAVYLWHCDRDGNYSLYTKATENYLRGVQETDASGKVTFMSIFPAAYPGRWPHIHFEMFKTLAGAAANTGKVRTTQLALPEAECKAAFATAGYEASVRNLAGTSLSSDMVFRDGSTLQLPTISGDATSGYVISLVVGISP
jgi:protocatechuate 3,4-dioxygenase beta subunit